MTSPDKSRRARRSRNKGASFEREIARALREFYPDARRQPQSDIKRMKTLAESDPILASRLCLTDVVAGPFGLECKHRKRLPRMGDTLVQATEDVGESGKIPLAIHRGDRWRYADIEVGMRQRDYLRISRPPGVYTCHDGLVVIKWPEFVQCLARLKRKGRLDLS